VDADIGQPLALDLADQLGLAVDEWLGAEDQHVGMGRRLAGEVLAAAEADLDPKPSRAGHQRLRVDRARGQVEAQFRQPVLHQLRASGAQRAALDPAEGAHGSGVVAHGAGLAASSRARKTVPATGVA
jgi:hypothetical protein